MALPVATSTNRAVDAAKRAIAKPAPEDNSIQGAQGISSTFRQLQPHAA